LLLVERARAKVGVRPDSQHRREAGEDVKTTVQIRLYPTPEQAALLRAHTEEYVNAVNALAQALDYGMLPDDGMDVSTKDFTAALPSAVKNHALRDARSVYNRSFELGTMPVQRRPPTA
jgi:acetoin utilization deacetylase AcuC-like enzyme